MTDLIPESFRRPGDPDTPSFDVDVINAPDPKFLPAEVRKVLKARDEAYERFVDLEDKYLDLIGSNWRKIAQDKDRRAARQAVAEGKDPFELPSALEQAERDRPRALAVVEDAARKARAADRRLRDAIREHIPQIGQAIGRELKRARDAYLEAQEAANQARARFGGLLAARDAAVNWELGVYSGFPQGEASPRLATGGEAAEYGHWVGPGLREVKLIEESYRQAGVRDLYGETGEPTYVQDPKVRVRARNGLVMELKASHALSLERSGSVEILEPDRLPEHRRAQRERGDA